MMNVAPLRQHLVDLIILLGQTNPMQIKAMCQFVQNSPVPNHEAWLPHLLPVLQKATPPQVEKWREIIKKGEDGNPELQSATKEIGIQQKDVDNFRGAFILLLALYQLQKLLQSLSILQLMKMFEIMPPVPPVQQLQLLQQIQQLFAELKPEALVNLQKKLQESPPGKEHNTLVTLLNLTAEFFQLYQPLKILLQLELDELLKLRETFPTLEPPQILQLLQLLQLEPFDALELRNLLNPSENIAMDMGDNESDKRSELHLQIVDQPPEKSVYKRNLKPNPVLVLQGDPVPDGNLYVAPVLLRCDTFTEENKYLTGNRPVRVAAGRVLTFRKLKITTTSHQQQETLFCIKFELRRYTSDDQYTVVDSIHSSPICVLSHSTQMKPTPTVLSTIAEVIPATGSSEGGSRVAILGSQFIDSPACRIRFDSTDCVPIFHGPGTLICQTPQHAPGTVQVRVSNTPKKYSETFATFTYVDNVTMYSNSDQLAISLDPPQHFDDLPDDWPSNQTFELGKEDDTFGNSQYSSGLDFNSLNTDLDARGYHALHYHASFGNFQKMKPYLPDLCDVRDKNGNTPLHWAVFEQQMDCVKQLIASRCQFLINSNGDTPLSLAIRLDDYCMVQLLIENGHPIQTETLHGESPLHLSVTSQFPILELLLQYRSFLNAQDGEGDTPLHWAIRQGNEQVVQIMLEHGADCDIANDDGETPLLLALQIADEGIISLLLDRNPTARAQDIEGCNALHNAAARKRIDLSIVKRLIENGTDLHSKDSFKMNCLDIAVQMNDAQLASFLAQKGVVSPEKTPNVYTPKQQEKVLSSPKQNILFQKASSLSMLVARSSSFIDV